MITIYTDMGLGKAKASANVDIVGNDVIINSNDKFLMRIIEKILPLQTKIKRIEDNKTYKEDPGSDYEDLMITLRQNIHSPYYIGKRKMIIKDPKWKSVRSAKELKNESNRDVGTFVAPSRSGVAMAK